MGLGGVATAALPSVVRLQMVFSDRLGGSSSWAQTSDIKTSENVNNPERVYTISNCNGLMMTPYTSPTRTNENAGKFAFYAASTEGQYLIYNVDSKVWVSYDKAYSYSNGPGKAKLISDKTNAQPWLEGLKEKGFWVVGADMDGESLYYEANLKGPLVIVMGAEGKGVSPLTRKLCDFCVRIPMKGKVSSLNVSVAAALLIYEAAKQRGE